MTERKFFKNFLNFKRKRELIQQTSWASLIGCYFASCIIVGFGIGLALDTYLGTKPWCTFIFLGYGILAAFKYLYDGYKAKKW